MEKLDARLTSLETDAHVMMSIAQKMLRENAQVKPHAIIRKTLSDGEIGFIYVDMPPEKTIWKMYLTFMLKKLDAERYFFVDEVWFCASVDYDPTKPVSENPAKTEALAVFAVARNGERLFLTQQFLRDPDGIKLLELKTTREMIANLTPDVW